MAATGSSIDALLDHLKTTRGFDFTGYKRTTLERRLKLRMGEVGIEDYDAYVDFLEVHPGEFELLFNTILINVTAFFRDPAAWEHLTSEVMPALLAEIPPDRPIRIWCAGCASGEEAYTLAIVFAHALGDEAYGQRVKIYATDVDEEALAQARAASYSAKSVEAVPQALAERYFDRVDQRYVVRADLRRSVIFGRNDLVQDAPISRIDLLSCRNTLMYFTAETQARILGRFHFALAPAGSLLLGKSEMLITHSELFRPIDARRRIFRKVPRATLRDSLISMAQGADGAAIEAPTGSDALGRAVFDAGPVAQIVIEERGALVAANHAARELLSLSASDVGRAFTDLEISYQPADVRAGVERAVREQRVDVTSLVGVTVARGRTRDLEVQSTPLLSEGRVVGCSVTFVDVTGRRRVEAELEQARRELQTASLDLQSTVEELETTNEELQSTNEELETTNEELQSTNEELETTNEELQSTNEELETMNEELRERGLALDQVNGFLETILTGLGTAVVVVDRSQVVTLWNQHATDLWGLRTDEVVGQHLLGLDIGLPLEDVRDALRAALLDGDGRTMVVVDAISRRGRALHCRVTCVPLRDGTDEPTGALLLMEPIGADGTADALALRSPEGVAGGDGRAG
jgi:two-component system CheB/CheR fusion protein